MGKLKLEKGDTAVLFTDPQNDFLSEGGVAWKDLGERVKETKVVEHLVQIREAAKAAGIPVFYSPHYYTDEEYESWQHLNPIDRMMFENKMFRVGGWGAEFHPDLEPDENTVVLHSHKGASNFWTGDTALQFRERGIQKIVLAGMSANICTESHLRDAVENGFDVIMVKDATTGITPEATQAAHTNYEFFAEEVVTTDEILERLK
ncbi:MAG: cysteine hydrolase [Thermoplasmata archaeon]